MTVLSTESPIPQMTALNYKICHFYVTGRANGRWNLTNYVIHMSRKKHSIGTLYYLQDTPPGDFYQTELFRS